MKVELAGTPRRDKGGGGGGKIVLDLQARVSH